MKEFKSNSVLNFGILRPSLLFYFLTPYFVFLYYYNFSSTNLFVTSLAIDSTELFWALKNSFLQSVITSTIVVILSLPMSQGLFFLPDKIRGIILRLLIIPLVLPALYSVLIALALINPFPMGTSGIIFLFVLVNLGFSTILTYSATREKLGNLAVISEIYSLRRIEFYKKIFFPLLQEDLVVNFFMIFIFCFSSFSIPLLLGGGRGTNLEVLIYEKIFIEQNWSAAFTLCLLQTFMIFSLSFFILKTKKRRVAVFNSGNYLKSPLGMLLILGYLAAYLGGYVAGLIKSISYLLNSTGFVFQYAAELLTVTLFTTRALLIYLLLNFILLFLWLIDYLNNRRFNLAINLISVSTVLVGFSLYLALPLNKNYDLIKINLAMSILFFPSLFKLFLQKPLEGLRSQILIAQMYGLSKMTIIFEIIFKQISQQLLLWLSFLIIWFIGEYAILRALGVQTQTLGLLTESFLSSYRLPLSYLMSFYILIYWLLAVTILYFSLKGTYVVYKKFIS